jgi:hypothetical protein
MVARMPSVTDRRPGRQPVLSGLVILEGDPSARASSARASFSGTISSTATSTTPDMPDVTPGDSPLHPIRHGREEGS